MALAAVPYTSTLRPKQITKEPSWDGAPGVSILVMNSNRLTIAVLLLAALTLLPGWSCHSDRTPAATYTVGGTVTGISGSVVLHDNGGDALTISSNGSFTFATPLANGAAYAVAVATQPAGQTCTVSAGSGTVSGANVSSVAVACAASATYSIGGSVTGLTGTLKLADNGADTLTINANGAFSFATQLTTGAAYAVTVDTQPSGQTCSVASGSGTVASAAVTSVAVTCVNNPPPTYAIGGNVTGLTGTLKLTDNGTDTLTVTASGSFTFATQLLSGATFAVTIGTQPSGQVCTVSGGSGSVASANVTSVAVSCADAPTYSVGGTVSGLSGTLKLNDNGADTLTVTANGTFTFATQLASGANYAVTVAVQPAGQTCAVSSGSGTVASSNVSAVSVTCAAAAPQFAYVANNFDSDVSAFSINSSTGALTAVTGSPFGMPYQGVNSVAATPAVVVATTAAIIGNGTVSVWTITSGTGGLTPATGSPYVLSGGGASVTVNAAGTFAYVPYNADAILAYSIDATTGALTAVTGSPFATGSTGTPGVIAINAAGTFAYVPNSNATLSGFGIDSSTGALTPLAGSPFAVTQAKFLAISGSTAYAVNSSGNSVSAYTINSTTGALTAVTGSPFATGSDPGCIAVNPAGTFLYVSNGAGTVSAYSINSSTGALTAVAGSPFAAGTNPSSVVVDNTGSFLYVTNAGNSNVSAYSINATTGVLTPVAGSPFAAGTSPTSIAISQP
jgi:6-phosphogluconolactonase (cycloisomerase 2 family)